MSDKLFESICKKWPEIRAVAPPASNLMTCRSRGGVTGCCTHPEAVDPFWVHSRGGKRFLTGPIPPGDFFCVGIQDRGGSAYLFLMWRRGHRSFWFYDQFVVYYTASDYTERVERLLKAALHRWDTLTSDVIFSGPWGWFDPQLGRFETDDEDEEFPEEWEPCDEDPVKATVERLRASFSKQLSQNSSPSNPTEPNP